MPNWTTNRLEFYGDNQIVLEMILKNIDECIKKDVGIMNHFVPRPAIYDIFDTTNHSSKNMKIGETTRAVINDSLYHATETVVTQEFLDRRAAVDDDFRATYDWYEEEEEEQ